MAKLTVNSHIIGSHHHRIQNEIIARQRGTHHREEFKKIKKLSFNKFARSCSHHLHLWPILTTFFFSQY